MLLKRFYHEGLAQASYLIDCQRTGEALVVDASRDADQYIAASLARLHGITNVANLRGGIQGWQEARLPVEREPVAVSA